MSVRKFTIAAAAVVACYLTGCSQEPSVRSALELMEDPPVLEAVVMRCQDMGQAALSAKECLNAREAVERLAAQEAARHPVQDDPGFERARELRRARDERERQRNEAEQQVDPYTMPLVKDPQPADVVSSLPAPVHSG